MDERRISRANAARAERRVIGRRIAHYRMLRGMLGKELAEAVGVSPGTVTHWEKGRSKPSPIDFTRLAAALRVTVPEITDVRGAEEDAVYQRLWNELQAALLNVDNRTSIDSILRLSGSFPVGVLANASQREP